MENNKKVLRNIAKAILLYRKNKKYTQSVLAKKANVDRTYLARIEEVKANPSIEMLVKISNALDISILKLFSESVTIDTL